MLASIAAVRAFIYRREEATLEDLPLLKKIALDTINQRDEELLRKIYLMNKQGLVTPFQKNILEESRYTPYTVRCVLEDLCLLKIVIRKKVGRKHLYDVSTQMKEIIEEAKLYNDSEALVRENPKIIYTRGKTGEGRSSRVRLKLKRKENK
jgi:predicted transcriptional regulator